MIEFLKSYKIAILWFWVEWKSTLNFLLSNWIDKSNITICDRNTLHNIDDIKIISWNNYLDNLWDFDYIFKSPWISPYTNNLKKYSSKILTQANLFFEIYKWKIISITQTKWKSTTSTLIYKILKNAWYNVKLVWNIWKPVLDEIDFSCKYDYIVYELSSYMLEELDNHHSEISILWNIYPDHLDWHDWFDNYKKSKEKVLNNSNNLLIWYTLYPKLKNKLLNRKILSFGWESSYYSHLKNSFFINWNSYLENLQTALIWDHNYDNICACIWVCDILWVDKKYTKQTLNNFIWLNHRLQDLWTYNWVKFIDDAISTTPESTIAWIKALWEDVDTIFLWWTNRWYDFSLLYKILEQYKIKNIVLFPDTWDIIYNQISKLYNILKTDSMQEAVEFAYKYTWEWKICLLSTASPSYSLWKNYQEKWNEFLKYIQELS